MALTNYEEERLLRIAENKQRMHDLGLLKLAATLASPQNKSTPKPRTLVTRKRALNAVIRRSER